jgi:hypothetical protein
MLPIGGRSDARLIGPGSPGYHRRSFEPGLSHWETLSIALLFPVGELLLGKLSETVADRPGVLVCRLVGNRASFFSTKAPMVRVPNELSGWHSQDPY